MHFNKVLKLQPEYVDAYFNKGIVHQNNGELDLAIKAYHKVYII